GLLRYIEGIVIVRERRKITHDFSPWRKAFLHCPYRAYFEIFYLSVFLGQSILFTAQSCK
ncbi:MAG: hypothetical protein QHH01_00110, partial [Spirochaetales bacterium]|nr:hypothetical protein [Spirochaetales bacterium]